MANKAFFFLEPVSFGGLDKLDLNTLPNIHNLSGMSKDYRDGPYLKLSVHKCQKPDGTYMSWVVNIPHKNPKTKRTDNMFVTIGYFGVMSIDKARQVCVSIINKIRENNWKKSAIKKREKKVLFFHKNGEQILFQSLGQVFKSDIEYPEFKTVLKDIPEPSKKLSKNLSLNLKFITDYAMDGTLRRTFFYSYNLNCKSYIRKIGSYPEMNADSAKMIADKISDRMRRNDLSHLSEVVNDVLRDFGLIPDPYDKVNPVHPREKSDPAYKSYFQRRAEENTQISMQIIEELGVQILNDRNERKVFLPEEMTLSQAYASWLKTWRIDKSPLSVKNQWYKFRPTATWTATLKLKRPFMRPWASPRLTASSATLSRCDLKA